MPLLAAIFIAGLILVIGWPTTSDSAVRLRGVVLRRPAQAAGRGAPWWTRLIPAGLEEGIRGYRQAHREGPDLLHRRLVYARLEQHISPEQFLCLRVMVPMGLAALLTALYFIDPAPLRGMLIAAGTVVGALVPDHWLKQQIQRRQESVRRELPALLTTLGVLLDAGLNLQAALHEITGRKEGVLADTLREALRQTALGAPVAEALTEAAERCGVQELTLFVSVVTQALARGAGGVSEAVRSQSRQIWALRQQQVQERGQEMSQDLFLVLLLLAFPAIALFLLGPVGLSLAETFFR